MKKWFTLFAVYYILTIALRKYIAIILNNKIVVLPFFYLGMLILGVFIFNLFVVDYINGFKVFVGNKEIALVKDYEVIHSILSSLEQDIEKQNNLDIVFDEYLLKYQKTESTLDNFTSLASLEKSLKENVTYKCKCWALVVDGKEAVYLREKENVEKLIKELRDYYIPMAGNNETINIRDVKIMETFKIDPAQAYYPDILTEEKAFTYVLEGTEQKVTYEVKSGDNFYSIARDFHLDPSSLIDANPNLNPRLLKVGDSINLTMPRPLLNIEISYQHIYEEIIPAPIIVQKDNTMLRTQTVVEEPGDSGNKRVYADITLHNGFIKTREVSMEEILKTPRLRILRQGTQRTPDDILVASAFLPPGIGIITSKFGAMRWNKPHTGIDIAVGSGTNVLAYRAGVIKFAGWNPWGYGNLVVIDHGDGFETYYAHNSVILVEVGQNVSKGDVLSLSGNTGISTGPHVHFEVRINGLAIDPLAYLKGQ
jgi:murein DD-endopeptidase MepM/ murein hydrolase activator NlpD